MVDANGGGSMTEKAYSFSLAISHTPWIDVRRHSLLRLRAQLYGPGDAPETLVYRVFDERAPNDVWSLQMWEWAAAQDVDWCLFLQDDAIVSPHFWEDLQRVCARAEDAVCEIIGLQAPHPAAKLLADEGVHAGFTTCDGVVGVGYAIRRRTLGDFLFWRARQLDKLYPQGCGGDPSERCAVTEDTLLGLFAAATHLDVYHPIPTIVDHDTSIPSEYGNDTDKHRRSTVRWDTPCLRNRHPELAAMLADETSIPHLGRFYAATPALLEAYTHTSIDDIERVRQDDGRPELRRARYAALGRPDAEAPTIWIATPSRGDVAAGYCRAVWSFLREESFDIELSSEVVDVQIWNYDLVRTRNRMVWHFLHNTDADILLMLDGDVAVTAPAIRGMLAACKDFVATPYPRRAGVNWQAVQRKVAAEAEAALDGVPPVHPEAHAYGYSLRLLGDAAQSDDALGILEVESVPFGCVMLGRSALQALYDSCEESYLDILPDGRRAPVKNLFGLLTEPGQGRGGLLSEDFSFCARWRASGRRVWLYLGDGSPADHYGSHVYGGHIEAFGLRRESK